MARAVPVYLGEDLLAVAMPSVGPVSAANSQCYGVSPDRAAAAYWPSLLSLPLRRPGLSSLGYIEPGAGALAGLSLDCSAVEAGGWVSGWAGWVHATASGHISSSAHQLAHAHQLPTVSCTTRPADVQCEYTV